MRTMALAKRGGEMLPRFTLLMALVAIGLFFSFGIAPESLVYDREAVFNGEWWRLVSGHFVHSDGEHALWDILALFLIGSLLEQRGLFKLLVATMAGLISVNCWLIWGTPELAYYCGLSGILNTLLMVFLFELLIELKREKVPADGSTAGKKIDVTAIAVLLTGVLILGKILLEMSMGHALFTDAAWPSVPSVHLAGAMGSLLYMVTRDLKFFRTEWIDEVEIELVRVSR